MANELAIIAIKGGRFSEAESMFNSDLQANPSSSSFFGLGVCKLNMLLDINRTPEEVVYCFEKAVSLAENESEKEALKEQANMFLLSVLKQYSNLYIELEARKKAEATKALIGLGLTIGAAVIGSSKGSNAFTQIASLAVAGAGVEVALGGLSNIGKIPDIQAYIIKTGNTLASEFVRLGIGDTPEYKAEFDSEKLLLIGKDEVKEKKVSYFSIQNKDLEELKNTYLIDDEDFLRMSVLANSIKTIALKNFKENEELKKEWEDLMKKYEIGFMKKGDLLQKLKKNPIH